MGMKKPIPFPTTNKNTVVKAIRKAAQSSENIFISRHALQRMAERSITRVEVNRCVRHGQKNTQPFLNEHGNWQVELLHTVAGKRLIVQAVLSEKENHTVIVVTTWRLL